MHSQYAVFLNHAGDRLKIHVQTSKVKIVHTGSPGNVSLNARSSRSLSLTWTSPANLKEKHGSFVAYSVKCWSKGQITAAYKLENVTQVIIDQCLPFSTYNCCVSLQTTQANSTAMCQQQRTPEDGKINNDTLHQ